MNSGRGDRVQLKDPGEPWDSIERVMTPIACAAVLVFVVWGLTIAGAIVANLYGNSDAAAPLVFAQYFGDRVGGEIITGNSPWYESLYLLHLTSWVPSHVQVWKGLPFLIYGATLLLAGWTVSRSVSPRAGLLAALAMAAPVPVVLLFAIGPVNAHVLTLFHTVLLAAFLVTLPRLDDWSWAQRVLWGVVLAITLAPGASSDVILLLGAVLPFLVAVGYAGATRLVGRGTAGLAGAACLVGTLGGRALATAIEDQGIRTNGVETPFSRSGEAFANVRLLLEDVATFAHGLFGGPLHLVDGVLELVAIATVVALPILVYRGRHQALRTITSAEFPVERRLLAVYWTVAGAAVAFAFIASSAPEDGLDSSRYMLILWPALLTLGVIVYGRRALAVIATVAATSAALGTIQLAAGDYTAPIGSVPRGDQLEQVERFLSAEQADLGYAGYWDAMAITVRTDFRVRTYPVEPCAQTGQVCPSSASREDSWYRPKPGMRSFYLINAVGGPPRLPPPQSSWGAPAATATFGAVRVFVFDYDLASLLGPRG